MNIESHLRLTITRVDTVLPVQWQMWRALIFIQIIVHDRSRKCTVIYFQMLFKIFKVLEDQLLFDYWIILEDLRYIQHTHIHAHICTQSNNEWCHCTTCCLMQTKKYVKYSSTMVFLYLLQDMIVVLMIVRHLNNEAVVVTVIHNAVNNTGSRLNCETQTTAISDISKQAVTLYDYYAPPLMGGGIKRCFCLTSVTYIGLKSRIERPRKTKIGTEIANVTRD